MSWDAHNAKVKEWRTLRRELRQCADCGFIYYSDQKDTYRCGICKTEHRDAARRRSYYAHKECYCLDCRRTMKRDAYYRRCRACRAKRAAAQKAWRQKKKETAPCSQMTTPSQPCSTPSSPGGAPPAQE